MENFKTNSNNDLKTAIELAMGKTDHLTETLENNPSVEEKEDKTPTEQIAPKDTSAIDELEQATIVTKEKIIEIKRELGIHAPNEEAVLSLDTLKTAYNVINNDIKMHDTFNALIQSAHPNHVVHEE